MIIGNKKIKIKTKNVIILIVFIISFCLLIFSTYKIIMWKNDNDKTGKQVKKIEKITNIKKNNDNNKTKVIESNEDKSNPYWDYIKMKLIDVDFNELVIENPNTKGWIQVLGTNINYPFVQYQNNSYYLTHSFNNSYNSAGWVFMDYRNNSKDFDKNTIIYAHGRYDNTMFGSLKNILKSKWYSNINNHVIKISTLTENTLWQVFSIYKIKTTNDYIQTDFYSDEEYKNFLDLIKNRSQFKFKYNISTSDKIITLSTCYNEKEKVVLHAKLIKKQPK